MQHVIGVLCQVRLRRGRCSCGLSDAEVAKCFILEFDRRSPHASDPLTRLDGIRTCSLFAKCLHQPGRLICAQVGFSDCDKREGR